MQSGLSSKAERDQIRSKDSDYGDGNTLPDSLWFFILGGPIHFIFLHGCPPKLRLSIRLTILSNCNLCVADGREVGMHAYTLKPIIVVGVAQRKIMENSLGGGGLSNEHARAREGRGRNFDGLELFTCSKPPLRKNQFAEMQFMSDNLGSCSITLPDVCTYVFKNVRAIRLSRWQMDLIYIMAVRRRPWGVTRWITAVSLVTTSSA